jgi:hypothetical protein
MNATLKTLIFFVTILSSSGCKLFQKKIDSGVKYGINRNRSSLEFFKGVQRTGKIEVCVKIEKYDPSLARKEIFGSLNPFTLLDVNLKKMMIKRAMDSAFRKWNTLFLKVDLNVWSHQKLQVEVIYEPECTILVGYLSPRPDFSRLNVELMYHPVRASVLKSYSRIKLSLSDLFDEFTLSHEIGHLFGLADLYQEGGPTAADPLTGQPETLMNNHTIGFTSDEEAAAKTLFQFLKTAELRCIDGYKPFSYSDPNYQVHPGSIGSLFCIKEGSDLKDSYTVVAELESEFVLKSTERFFTEKTRSDSLACQTKDSQKAEIHFSNFDKDGNPSDATLILLTDELGKEEYLLTKFGLEHVHNAVFLRSKEVILEFMFPEAKRMLDDKGNYIKDDNGQVERLRFDSFMGHFVVKKNPGKKNLDKAYFQCSFEQKSPKK